MTLAYVFWHWPAQHDGYETAIERFHAALDRPGTATFHLERAPWASPRDAPYEDWYPVDDWAALGELNDFAISGGRKAPHDAVAQMSRSGAGGVYRRLQEGPPLPEVRFAAWLDRAPDPLPDGAAVWQRQLVLGPAPEYAVLGASPVALDAGGVLTGPRLVAARA